jgi:hypothetical protein
MDNPRVLTRIRRYARPVLLGLTALVIILIVGAIVAAPDRMDDQVPSFRAVAGPEGHTTYFIDGVFQMFIVLVLRLAMSSSVPSTMSITEQPC